jgi:hypothetical protein
MKPREAAKQLEIEYPEMPKQRGSKATRLLRNYSRREQWFLMQAKAPATNRAPRRKMRSGLATFLASHEQAAAFIRQHQESGLVRYFNELQSSLDNMTRLARGPFG